MLLMLIVCTVSNKLFACYLLLDGARKSVPKIYVLGL